MVISFEQASIDVWRQVLVENSEIVVLGIERHPVRLTPRRRLRQEDPDSNIATVDVRWMPALCSRATEDLESGIVNYILQSLWRDP